MKKIIVGLACSLLFVSCLKENEELQQDVLIAEVIKVEKIIDEFLPQTNLNFDGNQLSEKEVKNKLSKEQIQTLISYGELFKNGYDRFGPEFVNGLIKTKEENLHKPNYKNNRNRVNTRSTQCYDTWNNQELLITAGFIACVAGSSGWGYLLCAGSAATASNINRDQYEACLRQYNIY